MFVSGNDGGLYKIENNGQSWTDISDGLQIHNYKSVFLKLIMIITWRNTRQWNIKMQFATTGMQ